MSVEKRIDGTLEADVFVVVDVESGESSGDRIPIPITGMDVIKLGIEKGLFDPWHEGADLRITEINVALTHKE